MQLKDAPNWGIEPVPERLRVLGCFDTFLLWANLGVTLLVLVAATLLRALAAAGADRDARRRPDRQRDARAAGMIGADARVPSMVLMRAPLGRRGSYPATGAQRAPVPRLGDLRADRHRDRRRRALGPRCSASRRPGCGRSSSARSRPCSRCSGPIGFVRRFVRKLAIWVVLASLLYLDWWTLDHGDVSTLWGEPGQGGSFWFAVDLVIALPVSWIPLVADYTRFSRDAPRGVLGRRPRLPAADAVPVRLRLDPRALAPRLTGRPPC